MDDVINEDSITMDDRHYSIDQLSDAAKLSVISIRFSDEQIAQRQNELAISSTARNGYLRLFNAELEKSVKSNE